MQTLFPINPLSVGICDWNPHVGKLDSVTIKITKCKYNEWLLLKKMSRHKLYQK